MTVYCCLLSGEGYYHFFSGWVTVAAVSKRVSWPISVTLSVVNEVISINFNVFYEVT